MKRVMRICCIILISAIMLCCIKINAQYMERNRVSSDMRPSTQFALNRLSILIKDRNDRQVIDDETCDSYWRQLYNYKLKLDELSLCWEQKTELDYKWSIWFEKHGAQDAALQLDTAERLLRLEQDDSYGQMLNVFSILSD